MQLCANSYYVTYRSDYDDGDSFACREWIQHDNCLSRKHFPISSGSESAARRMGQPVWRRLLQLSLGEGLTAAGLGLPDYRRALEQHEAYCAALEQCGLTLTSLESDPDYPDSTFVEDVAVVTSRFAVLARPGAPSRGGEVESVRKMLATIFTALHEIQPPRTVDGSDIC